MKIAEDDRVRRTRLGAGGRDIAVTNGASFTLRLELARLDPLHAEGAFLHHARAADGDVGVELLAERRRPAVARPIEPAHLVRTIVRAEPRADAADVDLCVQSFRIVIRRVDGTDRFARRLIALLAEHRHEHVCVPLQSAVGRHRVRLALDADPRHLPTLRAELFAHDRDVVFPVARDHARVTPGAGIQVDRHAPAVFRV